MNETSSSDEDAFAALLAAYDTHLAASSQSAPDSVILPDAPSELAGRILNARECLLRLERVWPRAQPCDDVIPKTIGRFEVIRELGRGGFGIVYLARDQKLNRLLALKVQRPEAIISIELRRRFLQEASLAARLRHPNIATIYEAGEAGVQIWMAAEYCEGDSLAGWLETTASTVTPRHAATFLFALANALQYSHRQGVLHRDVKPSNILLHRANDGEAVPDDLTSFTPKLIDFGLAKLSDGNEREISCGFRMGTPAYMAPEQVQAKSEQIGPSTDVYALGIVLYELLAGCPPFRADSELAVLNRVVEGQPQSLRALRPDVSRDLEAICLKCIQTDPCKRYLSAAELAADLHRYLDGRPTVARPMGTVQRFLNWAGRRPLAASLVALSLMSSLAMVAMTGIYVARLTEANRIATQSRIEAEESALKLKTKERHANQLLYASRMKLAFQGVKEGDVNEVRAILASCEPSQLSGEFRGFEWSYLDRSLHREWRTIVGGSEVYTVTFSPSGRILASGGQDGAINLWDPISGRQLASFAAHRSCVNALAYSPNGQLLASGSCDGTAKVWDADTNEIKHTLTGHNGEIRCLAISPDGTLLVTGGDDRHAKVWDLASGELIRTLSAEDETVDSIAWNFDRQQIFGSTATHSISWNLQDGSTKRVLSALTNCCAASTATTDVALALRSGITLIYNELGDVSFELPGHANGGAASLAFSSDGKWLVSGGHDRTVRIWGLASVPCRQLFVGHTGRAQSVAWSPDNQMIASGGFDGTIRIWKISDADAIPRVQAQCVFRNGEDHNRQLAFSSDLHYLTFPVSASGMKTIDLTRNEVLEGEASISEDSQIDAVSFVTTRRFCLVGPSADQHNSPTSTWEVAGNRIEKANLTLAGRLKSIGLNMTDGGRSFIGGRNLARTDLAEVAVSDLESGKSTFRFPLKRSRVDNSGIPPYLLFSPDCKTLAHCDGLGVTSCFRLDVEDPVSRREAPENVVAISNKADILAKMLTGTTVSLSWMGKNERQVLYHTSNVRLTTFSNDGRTCAIGTQNGRINLWNTATGQRIAAFDVGNGEVVKLQFSADDRTLAAVTFLEDKVEDKRRLGALQLYVWNGTQEN